MALSLPETVVGMKLPGSPNGRLRRRLPTTTKSPSTTKSPFQLALERQRAAIAQHTADVARDTRHPTVPSPVSRKRAGCVCEDADVARAHAASVLNEQAEIGVRERDASDASQGNGRLRTFTQDFREKMAGFSTSGQEALDSVTKKTFHDNKQWRIYQPDAKNGCEKVMPQDGFLPTRSLIGILKNHDMSGTLKDRLWVQEGVWHPATTVTEGIWKPKIDGYQPGDKVLRELLKNY